MMEFNTAISAPLDEGAWRRQQEDLDRREESSERELEERTVRAIAEMVNCGKVEP